jgi:hypothetical protein
MSNADPAEHKPLVATKMSEQARPAFESAGRQEAADVDMPVKKSPQSALARANSAIAEQRWDAAIDSLRVAVDETSDPTERDGLLEKLCGLLQEHLSRDCDQLEHQYATSPWATRRASARASRKTAIQPAELDQADRAKKADKAAPAAKHVEPAPLLMSH